MKRKILLVDDEVAILLTLKAVLEISGFQVDTAASGKEARLKLKKSEYAMVITDMRMESDEAGRDVVCAAKSATYQPAIALLTAFPVADEDWQEMGADNMLVKPMQIQVLLKQIDQLLQSHDEKLAKGISGLAKSPQTKSPDQEIPKKTPTKKRAAKKVAALHA